MNYFYSYSHFFSSVIFLSLGILILLRDVKSRVNQSCAAVLSCFFIWSFSFSWIHHPSSSREAARLFENLASLGWIWFGFFHLWFVWLYTKRQHTFLTKVCAAFFIITPIILVYQQWTNDALIGGHLQRNYGWLSKWNNNLWTYSYYLYCITIVLTGLRLIIGYSMKSDNAYIKKQSVVLLLTGAITLLLGLLFNIVIPLFKFGLVTPIGDIAALVWAFGLAYVAIKYNMLNITPFIATDRIIAAMKDLLFLLDTHGFIISVNKSATRTLSCRNHLLTGRLFADLIPVSEPDRETILKNVRDAPAFTGETNLSLPPGPVIPVALSTSLIPGTGIVCVAHNIALQKQRTESLKKAKKRLEERISRATYELQMTNVRLLQEVSDKKMAALALKESEERLRIIYEFAPDGICLIDHDGNLIDGNNESLRIAGYEKHELTGKNIFDVELIPGTTRERVSDFFSGNTTGERSIYREITIKRKNGSTIPAEISSHPIQIGGKSLNIVIIRDLTQRKKAETEAEELKRELHHAQKMDAIGKLAGGIAHDFNNLLGGIIGYAGFLRNRLANKLPEEAAKMQHIIEVSKQAAERTAQLLAFARKGKYRVEPVNIHDLINEVTELMEHTIDPRITLIKECRAMCPIINGDRSQLHSALLNLVVNARDALPDGGRITFGTDNIDIDKEHRSIRPNITKHGQFLKITVSDNGIGMDETTRLHIFEPFFSTKEPGKGTGLGLASVYGTITHHNGFIDLESAPGIGSTFSICLPTTRDTPVVEKNSPEIHLRHNYNDYTVLVVDDTPLMREMMVDTLTDLGYHVNACEGGKKALAWFRENHALCSLVILDFTMSDLNGKDCFAEMKKIKPSVKAIIASGHAIDSEIGSVLQNGALAFLQKPFEIELLIEIVQNALAGGNK